MAEETFGITFTEKASGTWGWATRAATRALAVKDARYCSRTQTNGVVTLRADGQVVGRWQHGRLVGHDLRVVCVSRGVD